MTDPAFHARVKALFMEAVERPPSGRRTWLAAACSGEPALLAEVEALLEHHDDAPLIAESPAEAPTSTGDDDPIKAIGEVLDERYAIEAFVAEGGFGYVYRGTHLRWQRPVAIKLFKPLPDDRGRAELEASFVKEGALLNDLSRRTTSIVQSYDIGTWRRPEQQPMLFTVLEWIDGQTLTALRRGDDGPWPLERVLSTLAPIAEALAVAHGAGVAHRDVKPGNIMLAADGEGAKLLDFGVAKIAAERQRGFNSTGGRVAAFTLDYAAPEQMAKVHGPTGPWTDVYALALVCVELLAGRHPYGDQDVIRVMRMVRDPDRRPTPRSVGVDVGGAVEAVFTKALAVNADQRQRDAGAFWQDLTDAAHAVDADTTTLPADRRTSPALAIALLIIALLVAAFLMT